MAIRYKSPFAANAEGMASSNEGHNINKKKRRFIIISIKANNVFIDHYKTSLMLKNNHYKSKVNNFYQYYLIKLIYIFYI